MNKLCIFLVLAFIVQFQSSLSYGQQKYGYQADIWVQFDFNQRIVPPVPKNKIRVIIDTDATNEIDDLWAITLALLSQERIKIEGFVAANYDNQWGGGPEGIENSYQGIKTILKLTGFEDIPVYKGSHPMRYKYEPSPSEGVDFIISKAMESTKEAPVWVISLGSATNIASAYLKNPEIINGVVSFWHGRTQWPEKLWNFNVFGDRNAAITLFHAPIPFVLFDTGTDLTCSMEESEKYIEPYGEIGNYLHNYRYREEYFMRSDKGFFDLGDIAAIINPDIALWSIENCPEIDPDLTYKFTNSKGKILRCYHIGRDESFKLLYDKLKFYYGD